MQLFIASSKEVNISNLANIELETFVVFLLPLLNSDFMIQ